MAISRPSSPLLRLLYENSLSLVVLLLIIGTLAGQFVTGMHDYNDELQEMGVAALSAKEYFHSGHFLEATFENWESEFLQMALYVLLTVWLRQKGSSESKKLYEPEEEDKTPNPHKKDAPWPVRAGGLALVIYQNSLSIAFFLLFLASFWLHAKGGAEVYSIEQVHQGKLPADTWQYMTTARFWFESLQNWQSEFLSILSIVGLSIFLRQYGSPESKPVDAAHSDTGR
jgi:hypothetical protein